MEQPAHILALAAAHSLLPELPPRAAARRVASRRSRTVEIRPAAFSTCSVPKLPQGARRIIIFANAALPYAPESILQRGDIVVHLNRALHATPAVLQTPGTTHWCYVRHAVGKPAWFEPAALGAFETVLFIGGSGNPFNHSNFAWYSEWWEITRKSPTTGFIAANTCRALFAHLPLLLIGFDPAHEHGTYRWSGHDWNAEAAWYRTHRFHTLPPVQYFHQIWIGGNMPERERGWTSHIRAAATKAGWQYRLWDFRALAAEFYGDPTTQLLAAAMHYFPHTVTYTLASDYYRLRLLATYPGIYADADFELLRPEFPAFPVAVAEHPAYNCACFFLARSTLPFAIAAELAAQKLRDLLAEPSTGYFSPAKCASFLTEKRLNRDGVDGDFLTTTIEPAWEKAGLHAQKMPYTLCAGRGKWWTGHPEAQSTFYHRGTAHWHAMPPAAKASIRERAAVPYHPRLHLLISSAAKYTARRAAIRETWLAHLPPGVTYQFYFGGDTPPGEDEPDVLWLEGVDDTYAGLPAKELASLRAATHEPLWDWLGQVDDDTYLCLPRLLPHLSREHAATLIGRSRGGERCPGGAGYFLRRAAVQTILDHADEIPATGRDDELITRCAVRHGHRITNLSTLHQNADESVPAPGNDTVSAHPLKDPAEMRRVHAAFVKI